MVVKSLVWSSNAATAAKCSFQDSTDSIENSATYSSSGEQFKQTSSGNPYLQNNNIPSGSYVSEDGEMNEDSQNVQNGMNFASRLQQFEKMQRLHRTHSKFQAQARSSYTSSSKEVQRPEEPRQPLPVPDMIRAPSRSTRRGSGQR